MGFQSGCCDRASKLRGDLRSWMPLSQVLQAISSAVQRRKVGMDMCSSKLLSREGNTKFRKGSNDPAQKRTRPKWIRRAECERSLSEIDRKTCSRSARFPSILIAKLFRVMNRYVGNLQPTPRGSGSKVTFCTDTAGQSLLAAFITYDKSYLRIARPHSRVFRLSPGALRREHVAQLKG